MWERIALDTTFPADVHELLNGGAVTFFDVVGNNGWGDRPVAP
ncbi:hypothetical protein [Mycolicibacterium litorale]